MLHWRIILGIIFGSLLGGICYLEYQSTEGTIWLLLLTVLITIGASQEAISLLKSAKLETNPGIIYLGSSSLLISVWIPRWSEPTQEHFGNWGLFALVLGICIIFNFLTEFRKYNSPDGVLSRVGSTLYALVYIGVLFSFVPALRFVDEENLDTGMLAVISMLVVVKLGDIGAYTVGRLIGKHKMAPILSPGKTIEGIGGAILFSVIGAWVVLVYFGDIPNQHPDPSGSKTMQYIIVTLYGVCVCLAGVVGDLAESLLKRCSGRKDSSNWMPGFGGILDLLDSVLFAACVAYPFWAIFWSS